MLQQIRVHYAWHTVDTKYLWGERGKEQAIPDIIGTGTSRLSDSVLVFSVLGV